MYANGHSVARNTVLAYAYYNIAASANKKAANNRQEIMSQLTPAQLAEAQKLSSSWSVGKPLPTKTTTWKAPVPVPAKPER